MKKLLITLLLSLPLLADALHLQEGFVAAHTEMLLSSTIDPLNTQLQSNIKITGNDITSLEGKFWIEMKYFSSEDKDRDESMYEEMKVAQYPLATYTLGTITKIEGENNYKIEGSLNFFGKDRPLTVTSEIILENGKLSINATSTMRVSEHGLTMPCLMFMCVRDEVDLFVKAVLVK